MLAGALRDAIEGGNGEDGWAAALADAESRLAEVVREIEACTGRGEVEYLDDLTQQRAVETAHRDLLAGHVEFLRRLVDREEMQSASMLAWRRFDGHNRLPKVILGVKFAGDQNATSVLASAASGSGLYVAGVTDGALPNQASSGGVYDGFLRKYDGDGAEVWTWGSNTEVIGDSVL